MHTLRGIILFSIVAWVPLLGYNDELKITDFRQPSYSVYGLVLSGGLFKWYYEDDVEYDLEISPYFHSLSDTREFDVVTSIRGHHWYNVTTAEFATSVGVRNYLFSSPLFLHGKLLFSIRSRRVSDDQGSGWDNRKLGDLEVGGGIGHLREGHFTVWALYINDILLSHKIIDKNLSDETISEITETFSKIRYFSLQHDREEKYVLQEIERILQADPACNVSIPILTWFELFEVIDGLSFYSGRWRSRYWRRLFGTRFSAYASASEIHEYSGYSPKKKFPLFDSLYYVPSVTFRFEYEKPLDLRKQLSFSSAYILTWYDSLSRHEVNAKLEYGYGIIDFFLLRGLIGSSYIYDYVPDVRSEYCVIVSPELDFSYYVEDVIEIRFSGGFDFRKDRYDLTANSFLSFRTYWRAF